MCSVNQKSETGGAKPITLYIFEKRVCPLLIRYEAKHFFSLFQISASFFCCIKTFALFAIFIGTLKNKFCT